jgi:hypothetical protein
MWLLGWSFPATSSAYLEMTNDIGTAAQRWSGATISPLDLDQIEDAVSELRSSHPRSILAKLVEEKIQALKSASDHFVSGRFEKFRISRSLSS